MCGICGGIALKSDVITNSIDIGNMIRSLGHRGPDNAGSYINNRVMLGHTRLSIIDLSVSGNQPMANEDKTVWIVFNGEIYNFQELRLDLLKKGHHFTSSSDTEVVLHGYEEWGAGCLDKFEGAFAFLIWDEKHGQFMAARDRFGEKPFYYTFANGFFYFASELSSLLEILPTRPQIDPVSLDLYLSYLFISAPYTIYEGIRQLPPANYILADTLGNFQILRYWFLSFANKTNESIKTIKDQIRKLLANAVSIRTISDVPIGVLLSGGVDSATIVASMREVTEGDILTFSIGSTDPSMNELERARLISRLFGTKHNEFIAKPDAIEIIPELIWHFGQPFADSSAIPTYYVSSVAHQHVKVVLSGDGGDEMFAGYSRYRLAWILQLLKKSPMILRKIYSGFFKRTNFTSSNRIIQRFSNIDRLMNIDEPYSFSHSFAQGFIQTRSSLYNPHFMKLLEGNNALDIFAAFYGEADGNSLLDRWINSDLLTMLPGDYLTKVDIASMACSLEVRVPFLDRKLAEYSASIPSSIKMPLGKQKRILKEAFRGILPNETLDHRKTGFSVPIHNWLRNELAIYVDKLMLEERSNIIETYLNSNQIKKICLAHRNGDDSLTTKVWGLLNLIIWEKMFLENQGSRSVPSLYELV